jgi:hypothetical protein
MRHGTDADEGRARFRAVRTAEAQTQEAFVGVHAGFATPLVAHVGATLDVWTPIYVLPES